MDRQKWLDSLKSGDRVATYQHHVGYSVFVVARRTPSGRILLSTGVQLNKNGEEISPASKWSRLHLEEVTSDVVATIRRDNLVSTVYGEMSKLTINEVRKMSNERLEELLAVLRKEESIEAGNC